VGTAANQVVQLDASAKLPAVDGTQVTGVVRTAGDTMTGSLNLPINGLVAGTNQLVLSGGNVGIRTTAPSNTLHVNGSTLIGSAAANLTNVSLNSGGPAGTRNLSIYYSSGGTNGSIVGDYSLIQSGYGGIGYSPIALNPIGGNVGIGTTAPQFKLDTNGAIRTIDGALWLTNSGKTADGIAKNWAIYNMTGGYGNSLQFWAYDETGCATGGMCVNRFTITDSGNVGIGTTAPGALLHVNGNIQLGTYFDNAGSRYIGLGGPSNAFGVNGSSGMEIESFTDGGNYSQKLHFWTHDYGAGTGSRKLSISETGNVGIVTTSPGAKLDIGGSSESIRLSGGAAQTYMTFYNGTTRKGYIGTHAGGTDMILHADSGSVLLSGGNVGIGTTAPATKFEIVTPTTSVLRLSQNAGVGNGWGGGVLSGIEFWQSDEGSNDGDGKIATKLQQTLYDLSGNTRFDIFTNIANGDNMPSTPAMTIKEGNVGIGTISPSAKLKVDGGQIAGTYVSHSHSTVDWNAGNIQTTSAAAGTITFTAGSMVDGGSYTLALNNSTGGSYVFSSTGLTFKCNPACPVVVSTGKDTVATFIKAGSTVYVSWVKDFQ
jgi:hypothetical protein